MYAIFREVSEGDYEQVSIWMSHSSTITFWNGMKDNFKSDGYLYYTFENVASLNEME